MQQTSVCGVVSSPEIPAITDLSGYVIIVVENNDRKIKLYGSFEENMDVRDEIINVNECLMEDVPRHLVVQFIHECIQSCIIKLRVKRRQRPLPAIKLQVQDAFLIAVEESARERLRRMSLLKQIVPVDMTVLSTQLNEHTDGTTYDYSFLKDTAPIITKAIVNNVVVNETTTTTKITPTPIQLANRALPATNKILTTTNITTAAAAAAAPINNNNSSSIVLSSIDHQKYSKLKLEQQNSEELQLIHSNIQETYPTVTPPLTVYPGRYNTNNNNINNNIIIANNIPSSITNNNNILNNNINNNTNNNINNNNIKQLRLQDLVYKLDCASDVIKPFSTNQSLVTTSRLNGVETNTATTTTIIQQKCSNIPNANFNSIDNLNNNNIIINNNNNNNKSLNNNNFNNINTNIISGAENVINSNVIYYTNRNNTNINNINNINNNTSDLLANGHGPNRELTTLSEGDCELPEDPYDLRTISSRGSPLLSSGGKEFLLGDQSLRNDLRPRRRSGSSIVVLDGGGSGGEEILKTRLSNVDNTYLIQPPLSAATEFDHLNPSCDLEMLTMLSVNQDNGPHREMAVDVPESFIARNKTPPRYPPPRPPIQLNGSVRPVPPPRDHLRIEKDGRLVNRAPAPQVPDRKITTTLTTTNQLPQYIQPSAVTTHNNNINNNNININNNNINNNNITNNHQIAQIVEPTSEQLISIKKYEEQLRRRREEEERIAQQNEFLRASLRGSRKLQALQDDGPMINEKQQPYGIENDAYADDEDIEKVKGYNELITALQNLQLTLNKHGLNSLAGRVTATQNLLYGPNLSRALAIRAAVLERRRPSIQEPICSNAESLLKEVVEMLNQSRSPIAIELCNLMLTYEMEGLLYAHDMVAKCTDRMPSSGMMSTARPPQDIPSTMKSYNQMSNIINNNSIKLKDQQLLQQQQQLQQHQLMLQQQQQQQQQHSIGTTIGVLHDSHDNIRVIQIEKHSEPLGATVRNEGEAVIIARIVRGGAAEKSGLLHEGDEILEVNTIEMRGKSVNDVCALLGTMTGTLTFMIVPACTPPPGGGGLGIGGVGGVGVGVGVGGSGGIRELSVLHVRAHFDYDPEDDLYIPCRELGISFQKGDVLHVISRDDPNWWQAYREGEEDQTLAGLIPSQSFQHQRESMKLAIAGEAGLLRNRGKESAKGSTLLCARSKGRKKKKKASSEAGYPLYATTTPDETDPEEILTYEEVALLYPRSSHKRPIVLIGPPNIGRHELRQRLMSDSDRFAAAVPHTSRLRRDGEVPGQDYHFISRAQFEVDILARKFVEHGEYEKAYYGTSLEAIRAVVASEKICVLNLHPQSLKLLRASDLKPYVVLVAPPSLEKLRQKKLRNCEQFKDDELKDIIATARDMEARWGHLFDMIIINNDTERAYHQLLAEINSLEREPQWVPASWSQHNDKNK